MGEGVIVRGINVDVETGVGETTVDVVTTLGEGRF